jgi:hypothetical protein
MEEAQDAAAAALARAALAQVHGGPGRRQASTVLVALRIPGDDGDRAQRAVDPLAEGDAPIGSSEADRAGAALLAGNRAGEQRPGAGGSVGVGGRDPEEERQARAAAAPGMHPAAAQEAGRLLGGRMADRGSRVVPPPGQDRALSLITSRRRLSPPRIACRTSRTNRAAQTGAPACTARCHCWEGRGTRGCPAGPSGRPQARAKAGQATSQACRSASESRQRVRSSARSRRAASL